MGCSDRVRGPNERGPSRRGSVRPEKSSCPVVKAAFAPAASDAVLAVDIRRRVAAEEREVERDGTSSLHEVAIRIPRG